MAPGLQLYDFARVFLVKARLPGSSTPIPKDIAQIILGYHHRERVEHHRALFNQLVQVYLCEEGTYLRRSRLWTNLPWPKNALKILKFFLRNNLTNYPPYIKHAQRLYALAFTPLLLEIYFLPILHIAVIKGFQELVEELLLDPKVNLNLPTASGDTPILLAVKHEKLDILKTLLAHPSIDPNGFSKSPCSPLHWAVSKNRIDMVQALLDHPDIDHEILDKRKRTPISMATMGTREENEKMQTLLREHVPLADRPTQALWVMGYFMPRKQDSQIAPKRSCILRSNS